MRTLRIWLPLLAGGFLAAGLHGQTTVLLPDSSTLTSTLNATVDEQAKVTVPATIAFDVDALTASTDSNGQSVTITNIVLASSSKQLRISLEAAATNFTPPVTGAATWAASDSTWNAASWTNATGATGTLSHSAFHSVDTCHTDAAACNTTALVFTLAANGNIKRSGVHSIGVVWKIESISGD